MNGRQLADAARRQRPELKVLFMTGYDGGAVLASDLLNSSMQVITKPFPMTDLVTRVQDMLRA
jgi:DNA-binding response OmpR family regulator